MQVKNVGFFHFCKNYADPLGSLQKTLSSDAANSLIVLPEAFNIGKFYKDDGVCDFNRSILPRLETLSRDSGVTFVAGLIIDDNSGIKQPPHSSAYLIDESGHRLMCHKAFCDRSGNYTHCEDKCDIENPIQHHNVSVAALICGDVSSQRCRDLTESEGFSHGCRIMCIPACMNDKFFTDLRLKGPLSEVITVLANSDPVGCGSFIEGPGGKNRFLHTGTDNKVLVKALDVLNGS